LKINKLAEVLTRQEVVIFHLRTYTLKLIHRHGLNRKQKINEWKFEEIIQDSEDEIGNFIK